MSKVLTEEINIPNTPVNMYSTQRAFIELHIAVFLWGFTAILGQLIQLSAIPLVWWRLFITVGVILVFTNILPRVKLMPFNLILKFAGVGCVVMLHWILFYASIKLANASVALISLSTTSFMSSIAEPLVNKRKIVWYEVSLGAVIIPAMFYVAHDLPQKMMAGLIVGLLCAVMVVIFSVLNKKMVVKADAITVTFLELGGGLILLTALMPLYFVIDKSAVFVPPAFSDWIYLIILAVLCTNLTYWLGVRSLRVLSAFATNLTVNLEPVYGIALAVILLKENKQLSSSFYIGAVVILFAVLSYPFWRNRFESTPEI